MTFFVEHYGYYFNQVLMAESAGYVRNSFVLASLGEHSEFEHLEKILLDAICTEPVDYDEISSADSTDKTEKYKQYETKDYIPTKHEYIE
jgi:cell filamentation protein